MIAVLVAISMASTARAQLPDSTFVDLSIVLDASSVAGYPSAAAQGLRVRTFTLNAQGEPFTTLIPDRKILDIWPQFPIGHGSTWETGPFVVRVAKDASPDTLKAELEQSFGIASCVLPETDPPLLGEAAKVFFPPEVGSSAESGFCWYQHFAHFPDPGEPPPPTLAEADCDECEWFFDGQSTQARELWQYTDTNGVVHRAYDDEYMSTSIPADMDLPQAWAITRGDSNIVIAVLDPHGVAWQHPDLSGYSTATGNESFSDAVNQVVASGGNVFVSSSDPPGLGPQSDPGRPGKFRVDDDKDGLTDEDWFGVQPDVGNSAQAEIAMDVLSASSLVALDTFEIQVSGASWTDDEYAGWELYMYPSPDAIFWGIPIRVARVTGNSSDVLTTDTPYGMSSSFVVDADPAHNIPARDGWLYFIPIFVNNDEGFVLVDVPSMDGKDDDDDLIPDDIRPYLTYFGADDDENGIIDDAVGYNFTFHPNSPTTQVPWGPNGQARRVDTRAEWLNIGNHGTIIAGILAAKHDADGWGAAGILPTARILPLIANSEQEIAAAIKYALSLRDANGDPVVDVITSSIGSLDYTAGLEQYPGLLEALQSAEAAGVIFTQSMENNRQWYPAGTWIWGVESVVTVGGTNSSLKVWSAGNGEDGTAYGPTVDIAARATQNLGIVDSQIGIDGPTATDANGMTLRGRWGHSIWGNTGNSFATPHVAGVAALVKHAYPHLSAAGIRERLYRGTDAIDYSSGHVPAGGLGSGRLNAYKALTWYGDISYGGQNFSTVWQDSVWVSGDIHVPAGHTLTITPGTIVHVAQDDISNMGDFPTMIEWFIEGTIDWQGDQIVFSAFSDVADSLWVSPYFAPGATVSGGTVTYEDVHFTDRLVSPIVGESFIAGQRIPITWTSDDLQPVTAPGVPGDYSRAETVKIEVSYDNGSGFAPVVSGYAVDADTFLWVSPDTVASDLVLLRVSYVDRSGAMVASSTSDSTLSIQPLQFAGTGQATGLSSTVAPYATLYLDADGDGDQDLLLSNWGADDYAAMFRADDNGFEPTLPLYSAPQGDPLPAGLKATRAGHVADYDGDGYLDIVLTGADRAWLLRNNGTGPIGFTDESATVPAFTAGADSSWAAAFADFDRDGDLDLYIGRGLGAGDVPGAGLPDLLLEQDGPGQFWNVSSARGIHHAPPIASTVVAWGDADADDQLDLFVGHGGGIGSGGAVQESKLYTQFYDTGDERAEFTVSTPWGSSSQIAQTYVTASGWADVDEDGNLDLVVASEDATDSHPSRVYWGNGAGGFDPPFDLLPAAGMAIADIDLDGTAEILLTHSPATGDPVPALFRAPDRALPRGLVEDTDRFGLGQASVGTSGAYRSIVVADLGGNYARGDGDLDILLGRSASANGEFFLENPAADDASTAPDWVRVKLVGLDSTANNVMGLGAVVRVTTTPVSGPPLTQTQVMGLGTSGAPTDELVFSLGYGSTQSEISVLWPDSYDQVIPIPSSAIGDTFVIRDDHGPGLLSATAGLVVMVTPGYQADWRFSWKTDYSTDPLLDQVIVKQDKTKNCPDVILETTLTPTTGGVTHVVLPIDNGRYLHTLTWRNRVCQPGCTIQFKVQSGTSVDSETSGWKSQVVSVCVN